MRIVVGPGTGEKHARANMRQFAKDVGLRPIWVSRCRNEEGGRYEYELRHWLRTCVIEMPGLELEKVRWLGRGIPARLYVDGDSWIWKFAVEIAHARLIGDYESNWVFTP